MRSSSSTIVRCLPALELSCQDRGQDFKEIDHVKHRAQWYLGHRQPPTRAVLQYRNYPDSQTKLSPAICIFSRPTKDFIPVVSGRNKPHTTWQDTLATREDALRNRHMRCVERLSLHTHRLSPLTVRDYVRIQNQVGPNPTKWDKTGVVIEVKQFNQYEIRVDGSGRVTLRNRKFLRKYSPVKRPPRRSILEDLRYLPSTSKHDLRDNTVVPTDRNAREETPTPPSSPIPTNPSTSPIAPSHFTNNSDQVNTTRAITTICIKKDAPCPSSSYRF